MTTEVIERSAVVQAFVDGVLSGSPMRCGVVVGPGGYGKSLLATEAVTALKEAGVPVLFVSGDLELELTPDNDGVIVVDSADLAADSLLEPLRSVALDPTSEQPILLFTRSISASPSLVALCGLADGQSTLEELDRFSDDDIAARLPKKGVVTAAEVRELTCAVPALVDRLCQGWDDSEWPSESVSSADQLPPRFLRHIEMEFSRIDGDDRAELAAAALTAVASPDSGTEVAGRLSISGLVGPDGRVPLAVAYAIEHVLAGDERRVAVITAAQPFIQTDPARAAATFTEVGSHDLAAVALAAAGRVDEATATLVGLPREGAAAAASAHIAGVESRWADAVSLVDQAGESHPYWSDESVDGVRAMYASIAGLDSEHDDSGSGADDFTSRAASTMRDALEANTESQLLDVVDDLRGLARQAKNQPPSLDTAITGAELASLAALTVGRFDLAQTMLDATPESPDRSPLSSAMHAWISVRSGRAAESAGEPAQSIAADTLRLAAELIEARRGSDAERTAETVAAIAGVVAQMSVDLLTFDALCEVHVGSHRVDARAQARDVADGLGRFIERRNSPLLDVRLAWSRIEAAVASGDAEAVLDEAGSLGSIDNVDQLAPELLAGAQQWAAIYSGTVDGDAVRSAVGELETAGYVWEAAALAGQAAIRTSDGALAKELLAIGREFRAVAPEPKVSSPAGLSEREIEIGLLVLKGHSYKEIGAECFISPKTVEHHVAHIRQKLVAVGVPRAEFRAKLQADLSPD